MSSSSLTTVALVLTHATAFVRTGVQNPRLCLTAAITLRDKPLAATPQRRSLTKLISAAGKLPSLTSALGLTPETSEEVDLSESVKEDGPVRPYEINLLDGLVIGMPVRYAHPGVFSVGP